MLYKPFEEKVIKLTEILYNEKLYFRIFCNTRTYAEQYALWCKGRNAQGQIVDKNKVVTNSKPGYSFHNFGLALDMVWKEKGWDWNYYNHDGTVKKEWLRYGEIAKSLGLRWGGDFKNPKDYPHIEYPVKLSLERLRNEYAKGGMARVFIALEESEK